MKSSVNNDKRYLKLSLVIKYAEIITKKGIIIVSNKKFSEVMHSVTAQNKVKKQIALGYLQDRTCQELGLNDLSGIKYSIIEERIPQKSEAITIKI